MGSAASRYGHVEEIDEALKGAELVFMPDPAFTQADNAKRIAPHLADGQVVFLAPGHVRFVMS